MKKKEPEKKKRGLKWWHVLLIIIVLLWLYNSWEEKNCNKIFETYTYSTGCYSACESKCYDEGFDRGDGYTLNYITYEGERRHCECSCEGCR